MEGASTVLQSIEQTVNARGLQPTPPNVFACLITIYQAQPPPDVLPSVLALLASYSFRVSPAMVKAKSVTLMKLTESVLRHNAADSSIVKRGVKLMSILLKTIPIEPSVLSKLQQLEPHPNNDVFLTGYLSLLTVAFLGAHAQGGKDAIESCSSIFRYVLNTVATTTKDNVAKKGVLCACTFLTNVVEPHVMECKDVVLGVLDDLIEMLGVDYRSRWLDTLQILAHYLESISVLKHHQQHNDPTFQNKLNTVLKKAITLHDIHNSLFPAAAEKVLKALAMCMDAQVLLNAIPIDETAISFRNKYILDVIRRSTSHDSLAFFVNVLMPKAQSFLTYSQDLDAQGRVAEGRQWLALHEKIWEASQAFFRYPRDFSDILYRTVARPLVDFLNDPIMRRVACKSFTTIAACAWEPRDDAMIVVLKKYSKNILPKICNLHEKERLDYTSLAIQAYARVSDDAVLKTIGETVNQNMASPTSEEHMQALVHVAICIAATLPPGVADQWAVNTLEAIPKAAAQSLEKQYYHLLAELLRGGKVQESTVGRVVEFLLESQGTAHPPSRKFRVQLMTTLIEETPINDVPMLAQSLTPEIIICAKESSTRTRTGALKLVQKIAKRIGAHEYLRVLQVGLAAKAPLVISGTLIAVAKLIWLHHNALPDSVHGVVQQVVSTFIRHPATEVRNAAFSFLRMLIKVSFRDNRLFRLLEQNLKGYLDAAFHWVAGDKVSSSTRQLVRVIMEKFIKRFGADRVLDTLPPAAARYGKYVVKMMERRERIAEAMRGRGAGGDEEFDKYFFENDERGLALKEDDEVADLAEPSVLRNMTLVKREGNQVVEDDEDDDEEFDVLVDDQGRVVVKPKDLSKGGNNNNKGMGSASPEKRTRENDDNDDDDERGYRVATPNQPVSQRKIVKAKRVKITTMAPMHTGDEFKSKSAGGDMKKPNRPDPYAYVPLDRKFLNKRNKHVGKERLTLVSSKRGSLSN
eukprot:PhF_6_TR40213/c0_g1_i2/m.59720/K14794/RRP12; ribosomal RNA-processing protein 12